MGEIMQTGLKTALAAAGFALATIPAFAVEMPTGSKNFSAPSDAPSYFTNEAIPKSARVDRAATFDEEDAGVGPAVSAGADTGRHNPHAAVHRSTRHSSGKSRGHWHLDALR